MASLPSPESHLRLSRPQLEEARAILSRLGVNLISTPTLDYLIQLITFTSEDKKRGGTAVKDAAKALSDYFKQVSFFKFFRQRDLRFIIVVVIVSSKC
jgi:hypothetical protein